MKIIKNTIKNLLAHSGYEIKPISNFNHEIRMKGLINLMAVLKDPSTLKIVQVGANDGKTNDPLFFYLKENNVNAILIEPLPDIYKKLKENYKNKDQMIFENVAIGNKDEVSSFYRISPYGEKLIRSRGNENPSGCSSFSYEHVIKHVISYLSISKDEAMKLIDKIEMETKPLADIFEKHSFYEIDLLQIDTEGFDYEVLKTIDFSKVNIKTINLEFKHYDNNTKENIINFFKINKYKTYSHSGSKELLAVQI